MAEAESAVRVIIEGRVQGVCFRAWTAQQAWELGISGWVRNRRDGTVEAVFAGSPWAVGEMIERCREGPPAARVARIREAAEVGPVPSGFQQRATV